MNKICLILPKGLPVPAVKGGAIESLMTDIINENEKKKKLDITVVSILDEKAKKESKKYKHTKFIYINTSDFKYKLKALKVRFVNLFGAHQNTYNEVTLDRIKKQKFKYVVVEDGAYHSFRSYLKYFSKDQMIVHFHHNGVSDKYTDKTFGRFLGVSGFVTNTFANSSTIEKCEVLKNGIDISRFNKKVTKSEHQELRAKLGFREDDFVVIFCGRLIKEKGVLELVRAIKDINNCKIKLVIVGSINFGVNQTSDYLNTLNEEINSSNGKVKLTGYVDNKEIYKYYKIADLAVVPSVWEDAAPLVTIEFMSAGVPLMITKTGGAPEYVSDHTVIIPKDKDLVKHLKNAISKLYLDRTKLDLMKKAGVTTAKKYTTEKFYDDFVSKMEK